MKVRSSIGAKLGSIFLILALVTTVIACSSPKPTPTPAPAPAPAPAPSPKPSPSPAPTASPSPTASPKPAPPPIPEAKLTMISGTVGGSTNFVNASEAAMWREKSGGKLLVSSVPSTGARDALNRLLNKEGDLETTAAADSIAELKLSIGQFKGQPPVTLYYVIPGVVSTMHVVVLDSSPIKTLNDLPGHAVSLGPAGTTGAIRAEQQMKLLGIFDKLKTSTLAHNQAMESLVDGKIDAWFYQVGVPATLLSQMGAQRKFRLLDYPQTLIDAMNGEFGGFKPYGNLTLKAGFYEGQLNTATVYLYDSPTYTRADVNPDVVYWLTRLFWENLDELKKSVPALRPFDETTIKSVPTDLSPFHPGALRYYQERGWR